MGATFENEEDLITKFKQKYNENGSLREKMAQLIVLIEKTRIQIAFQNKTIKKHMKGAEKELEKKRKK